MEINICGIQHYTTNAVDLSLYLYRTQNILLRLFDWIKTHKFDLVYLMSTVCVSGQDITARASCRCSTRWTGPSWRPTTAQQRRPSSSDPKCCWPASLTQRSSTTSSSWPSRTSCRCCWCSASPTPLWISSALWCRRRRGNWRYTKMGMDMDPVALDVRKLNWSVCVCVCVCVCFAGVHAHDGSQ